MQCINTIYHSLVKPEELKRIDEAFQRFSSKGGLLPKVTFLHDVLDQTVPPKLAEVRAYIVLVCMCTLTVGPKGTFVWDYSNIPGEVVPLLYLATSLCNEFKELCNGTLYCVHTCVVMA